MLQLLLGAAALAVLFYYYGIKPMYYWRERGVKQTNKLWVVGDNWKLILKLESFTEMVHRLYKSFDGVRYLGAYQFTSPVLIIKDPDLIKQVGVKDFEYFMDHRSFVTEEADPLFGKNLFSLKGQRWRTMRPIISPTFTSSKMKSIFLLMSECAENFSNFFLKKDQDIIELEMKETFTRYTSDVIATAAFGITTNSLLDPTNEFYMMGREVTDFSPLRKRVKFFGFFLFPKLFSFFKIGFLDKQHVEFFTNLIKGNIKTRREKGIVRQDMINILMEAQKGFQQKEENLVDTGFATVEEADLGHTEKSGLKNLTDMDIVAQAMIFFFAGFDGVASVMCYMAYELAINTDVQNKLREEIEETLKECKGSITYEALFKMKYLDMVLSETLRKWPIGVMADRICTKPYTIPPTTPDEKPVHIEKGTVVWIPVYGIHHNPAIYPDPERFDPERFNDENKKNINPYVYLPFGIGPRNCIANRFALLEIKIIFFHVLSKFEITPIKSTKIPLEISKKQINLLPEGGFPLGLKRLVK